MAIFVIHTGAISLSLSFSLYIFVIIFVHVGRELKVHGVPPYIFVFLLYRTLNFPMAAAFTSSSLGLVDESTTLLLGKCFLKSLRTVPLVPP